MMDQFDKAIANIDFPDPMDLRLAALYLNVGEQRMRNLLREERIKATKDESGRWVVAKADMDSYVETKGASRGGPRGDGKLWVIRVKHENLQGVKDALAKFEVELQPRYNYAKQREYREKKKAADAAAAKKAAPVDPKTGQPKSG